MINFGFWRKKKEVEKLRLQMISDKGDEVAMLRAANAEIVKVLARIQKRTKANLDDVKEILPNA